MTSTPDRRRLVSLVEDAVLQGVRPAAACAELGMSQRTLQRWRDPEGSILEDRRPFADRPTPATS